MFAVRKILWLHHFLGLNNKLKNIYTWLFSCFPLFSSRDHILFSSSPSKLCLFSYYQFWRSCFLFSDISSKSLCTQLFLHFKWEFHKYLQASLLEICILHVSLIRPLWRNYFPFLTFSVSSKRLYAQCLLQFKREFLKTLHACFLPYLEISITLQQFDRTVLKELYPFIKKFVCATLTSEWRIPQNFAGLFITMEICIMF